MLVDISEWQVQSPALTSVLWRKEHPKGPHGLSCGRSCAGKSTLKELKGRSYRLNTQCLESE